MERSAERGDKEERILSVLADRSEVGEDAADDLDKVGTIRNRSLVVSWWLKLATVGLSLCKESWWFLCLDSDGYADAHRNTSCGLISVKDGVTYVVDERAGTQLMPRWPSGGSPQIRLQ